MSMDYSSPMQPPSPDRVPAAAASLRLMTLALIGSVGAILLALSFVLPPGDEALSPVAALVQLVAALALHVVLDRIGYAVPALDRSLDVDQATGRAMVINQQRTVFRFVFAESIFIISLALAFAGVVAGGFWVVAVGAVLALALLGVHVYPWRRPVERTAERLEADGARTRLREAFGVSGGGPGGPAIQEL